MQEIRFTTLEGRQGVFIPTDGGWPQITVGDSKTHSRLPGAHQDHIFTSPQQLGIERAIREAREAAEGHIAQKKTADRLNRLEAEVKELRELWPDLYSRPPGQSQTREATDKLSAVNWPGDVATRLRIALAEDPELYLGYQNNIAMAFYYEGMAGCSPTVSNGAAMYTVANKAAKRFLDNFIHPIEKA